MRRGAIAAAILVMAACGSDDGDGLPDVSPGTPEGEDFGIPEEPSGDVVAAWPEAWCSVGPGDTRDELVEAMGTAGLDESPESLSWSGFNYQFNAFLGVDGNIRQMDINAVMLSQEEMDAIPCGNIRTVDNPGGEPLEGLP